MATHTVEEYTFQLPTGAKFSHRLESNNTQTLVLDFGGGLVETFNSGQFLTCTVVSAAAYLKVNFVMKGKFPDAAKYEIAKWVSGLVGGGCTVALNAWEEYRNEGPSGGNEESGGGRGPNDTGGSNPMAPGYNYGPSDDPKKGHVEVKPASVDLGLSSLLSLNSAAELLQTSGLDTQESMRNSDTDDATLSASLNTLVEDAAEVNTGKADGAVENRPDNFDAIVIIGAPDVAL